MKTATSALYERLLPRPKKLRVTGGTLTLAPGTPARIDGCEGLADYLFPALFDFAGADAPVFQAVRNDSLTDGGYTLSVTPDGVSVVGGGYPGIAGALWTLKLAAEAGEDGALCLPCMEIEDEPYKEFRGVHFYLPPADLLDDFLRVLDVIASLKYNAIILETGGGVEFDRHPEVNTAWRSFCREAREYPGGLQGLQASESYWKDSTHVEVAGSSCLKKSELRRIVDRCALLGLEIVPEIQALSHAYYLTLAHREIAERPYERWPDSYCPMCEESYTLYFDLADEILDVIRPKRVSIGHDEVRILGECPRCRGKSGHELLSRDINRLYDFYRSRGISIMMWGEKLQYFRSWRGKMTGGEEIPERVDRYGRRYSMPATYEAAHTVPRDILMIDWYYSQSMTTELGFEANGFDEIFGNFRGSCIADWEVRSRRKNVRGAEVSTWCVPYEYEIGFNGWFYELVFSAMTLWQEDYREARRAEFSDITENWLPRIREMMSGQRSYRGDAGRITALALAQGGEPLGGAAFLRGNLDGATAEKLAANGLRSLSEGETLPFDAKAGALLFLHAADEITLKRRIMSWYFLDKGPRIPARYAVDYEDGMCVTFTTELGYTIGCFRSGAAYCRPDAAGGKRVDIDDEGQGKGEVSLSPLWERADPWRDAAVYFSRFADFETADGPRTVYGFEWKNPYPEKKIVGIRCIAEPAAEAEARLFGAALLN